MRLAVAPADVGGEIGHDGRVRLAYAKYGAAFTGSAEPVWRLRRWHGCRTTGFADWIGDAEKFFGVRSVILLDGRGHIVDEIRLGYGTHNEPQGKTA